MTEPKFSQILAKAVPSLSASWVRSPVPRVVTPFLMAAKTGLCCTISRDTLRGRSAVSTTRRTKRSQPGRRSASAVMSTRRT